MKLLTGLIRNELGLTRTNLPMVKADVAAGSTDRESKIYNNELYNNKVNKPEEISEFLDIYGLQRMKS